MHTGGGSTSKRLLPSQFGLPRPCCRPKLHPALTHSHHVAPETKAVAAFQTQRYYTFFTQKSHSFITHLLHILSHFCPAHRLSKGFSFSEDTCLLQGQLAWPGAQRLNCHRGASLCGYGPRLTALLHAACTVAAGVLLMCPCCTG